MVKNIQFQFVIINYPATYKHLITGINKFTEMWFLMSYVEFINNQFIKVTFHFIYI